MVLYADGPVMSALASQGLPTHRPIVLPQFIKDKHLSLCAEALNQSDKGSSNTLSSAIFPSLVPP